MSRKRKDFLVVLLFLLLLITFFWRIIFGGEVLFPSGSLYIGSPWDYYTSARASGKSLGEMGDEIEVVYPGIHYLFQQIKLGKMPLWNPFVVGGESLPALCMFYPFIFLFCFFPVFSVFGYWAILHFFLLGVFSYLFMRTIRISRIGAFLGAVVVTFSGASISRIFPPVVLTFAWLPLILLFYEKSLKKREYFYSFGGGLALGMGFLTGDIKFAIGILLILFFYFLFRIFSTPNNRKMDRLIPHAIRSFLLICLFGGLIGAAAVIPMTEKLFLSGRTGGVSGIIPFQWPWRYFRLLLVPEVDPYTDSLIYVGPLAIFLAIFALIKRKKGALFWGSLAIIFLLLQRGGILDKLFSYLIPGYKAIALYDTGAMAVITFPIAILAALGIDALSLKRGRKQPIISFGKIEIAKYLIVAIVIINLFAVGMKYLIPWTGKSKDCYFETHATNFLKSDKELYRIIRLDPKPLNRDYTYLFPPNTSIVYEIFDAQGYGFFLSRRYGEFMNLIEDGIYRKKISDERILAIRNPQNLNSQLIDLVNIKYVLTKHIVSSEKYRLVYWKEFKIYQNKDYFPRAFIVPYAKVIKEKEEILKYMKGGNFKPAQEVIIEEPVLYSRGQVKFPYQLKVKKYESDQVEIEVDADQSGWLVLSDTYYPGWKVYVDGKKEKIYRANYCFRALPLLRGSHKIKFVYRPFSFYSGIGISGTTLAVLLFFLGKGAFCRKPEHFVLEKKNVADEQ